MRDGFRGTIRKKQSWTRKIAAFFCAAALLAALAPVPVRAAAAYTLRYDVNGAFGTAPSSGTYAEGASAEVSEPKQDMAKAGYAFDGWNTAADGSGTAYAAGEALTMDRDVTLYAGWKANSYTVGFANDGADAAFAQLSGDGAQTVVYGGHASAACTAAASAGYAVTGWRYAYTAADGRAVKGYAPGGTGYTSVDVRGDVTFHAVIYKTTFVSAAASGGKVSIADTLGDAGDPSSDTAGIENIGYGTLPVTVAVKFKPDSAAYVLSGVVVRRCDTETSVTLNDGDNTVQMADRDGNTVPVTFTLSMADGTVVSDRAVASPTEIEVFYVPATADYTVQVYRQNADGNGYTESAADARTVTAEVGSPVGFAVKEYAGFTYRAEKTVYADSTHADGTETPLAVAFDGTSAVRLYYDRNEYSLSFDANGRGTAPAAQEVRFGAAAGKPAQPEEKGFTFGGWYTDAGCSGTAVDFSVWTMPAADITLYAKWTEDPDVSIVYRSADGTMGSVSSAGESAAPATGNPAGSEAQAKDGFHFVSWTDQTGNVVSAGAALVPPKTDGLYTAGTYTANFAANTYRVTFNPQGGTVQETEREATCGKAYGALPEPVRAGYAFDGWYTETEGGTQIAADTLYTTAGNTTLYARWTANPAPAAASGAAGESVPSAGTTSPRTGDGASPFLWLALLAGAAFGFALAFAGKLRRRTKQYR